VVPTVTVAVSEGRIQVTRTMEDQKVRALHGLVRAELQNMIEGVTKGFERNLEITGVGYKGQVQGTKLSLAVGYTHPVEYQLPEGIEAKIDKQTLLTIRGIDKRKVGQVAADLRALKPPDVYKQKGIRYAGEKLRKKEGKTGK
jgi:large subunit ribosomal protein L6